MSKNILIVDDKPEIAKVITIQLSKDYNVHSEGNPIELLHGCTQETFPILSYRT